ncbi:hypothetical protein IWQ60_001766 [Tieghemiomyces parasiticus]|uniref:Uncharacterized protein n=1 Tax=Tieghemiomyces parasiticus TaxID=78921 RepID=A0A9W8AKL9_9FUNG|nr:hypothetical protein IWQ60_001766 [Tieghemiomyces parasiticus]
MRLAFSVLTLTLVATATAIPAPGGNSPASPKEKLKSMKPGDSARHIIDESGFIGVGLAWDNRQVEDYHKPGRPAPPTNGKHGHARATYNKDPAPLLDFGKRNYQGRHAPAHNNGYTARKPSTPAHAVSHAVNDEVADFSVHDGNDGPLPHNTEFSHLPSGLNTFKYSGSGIERPDPRHRHRKGGNKGHHTKHPANGGVYRARRPSQHGNKKHRGHKKHRGNKKHRSNKKHCGHKKNCGHKHATPVALHDGGYRASSDYTFEGWNAPPLPVTLSANNEPNANPPVDRLHPGWTPYHMKGGVPSATRPVHIPSGTPVSTPVAAPYRHAPMAPGVNLADTPIDSAMSATPDISLANAAEPAMADASTSAPVAVELAVAPENPAVPANAKSAPVAPVTADDSDSDAVALQLVDTAPATPANPAAPMAEVPQAPVAPTADTPAVPESSAPVSPIVESPATDAMPEVAAPAPPMEAASHPSKP